MNPDLSLFPNRMSVASETWDARSRSCAHRLVAGAGRAMLVAYREDPMLTLTALAHGVASDGTIVLATAEPELSVCGQTRSMDARLSIEKESADATVQIVASAAHALGRIEWLDSAQTAEFLVTGSLPERVAEIAVAPGGRLARFSTNRVLLHDATGVTPVMYDDIREQHRVAVWQGASGAELYENPGGELVAMDILRGYPPSRLNALFDGILLGTVPGALLSRQPMHVGCEHMDSAILCLDVDRTGLILMRIDSDEVSTVYVPFEQQVTSGAQLTLELASLFAARG